jgi:hypothetical protein
MAEILDLTNLTDSDEEHAGPELTPAQVPLDQTSRAQLRIAQGATTGRYRDVNPPVV